MNLAQLGSARSSAEPSPIERRMALLTDGRPEDQALYVGSGVGTWHAAGVVAYLTDFAPEWIYD